MIHLLYLMMPTLLLPPTAAAPTGSGYLPDTGERTPRYCHFMRSRLGLTLTVVSTAINNRLKKHKLVKSDVAGWA